ncbi:MAG: glutathione S-transferase [Gammaproteobacteria bacterium]|jgi:glutathione S-transferase
MTRKGLSITDSSLIYEYLSSLAPNKGLVPLNGQRRWETLGCQALAHGLLNAIITTAAETQIRPDQHFWPGVIERQTVKIERTLDAFEQKISAGHAPVLAEDAVNLGAITLACTLGYLAQRLRIEQWREHRPGLSVCYDGFSARASMIATKPAPIPSPHLDPHKIPP